jgi:multicomponent Na+:H+ antiporter subunit D
MNGSELGGLYKSMPWTTVLCIIGAASISGFPLFSGFVTKSMILTAAAEEGYWAAWAVLLFASAGVFHHSGIKIPFFAFFAHDQGHRVKEAPVNMLVAMGLAAALCIAIGVYPEPLYALLPYPVNYVPYTTAHVITMLQLLAFAALAFAVLMRTGLYPPELRSTNLDTDWVYRRLAPNLIRSFVKGLGELRDELARWTQMGVGFILDRAFQYYGPNSWLARTWPIGGSALCVLTLLGGYLIIYFI